MNPEQLHSQVRGQLPPIVGGGVWEAPWGVPRGQRPSKTTLERSPQSWGSLCYERRRESHQRSPDGELTQGPVSCSL